MQTIYSNCRFVMLAAVLLLSGTSLAHAAAWCASDTGCVPVLAGMENGQQRLVCRAHYAGGVHPGKTVAGRCNISYGGKEYPMDQYELLYAHGYWAQQARDPNAHPLIAGHESNGTPLVLCRADYNGATHPGKIVGGSCYIGWGGNEIVLPNYEIYFETE